MVIARISFILRTITLLMTIFSLSSPAYAKYSGGTGEPNDPYQIATAEDLMLLGESPEDYDKHFILTADIDLDPNLPGRKIFDRAVIAPDTNDVENWHQGTAFTGVFNGNGHTILRLTIRGVSYLGLFGQLDSGAMVSDLGLEAVDVNGTGDYIGGLVGSNYGDIINSCSTGVVSGNDLVGILAGSNVGHVVNSYSMAAVWGNDEVGGLVGDNEGGTVTNSYSTGTVSGKGNVGGLVGDNRGSVISSYSTGTVLGNHDVGGLVGFNGGRVASSYSNGTVGGNRYVGGLVGRNPWGRVTASFWDAQTSGQAESDGGIGLTTAQMQDINSYLLGGWDFVGEVGDGLHETWQMPTEGGYPVLSVFAGYQPPALQGDGTAASPYLIGTAQELGAMVYYAPAAEYRLSSDLDLTGVQWSVAVIPTFSGIFDGNGHTIRHLTIKGTYFIGLFGVLESKAKIKELGIIDANITSSDNYVGGLAGWAERDTQIAYCSTTGNISANDYVGGLVGGGDMGDIQIAYCSFTGNISGNNFVGGLMGDADEETTVVNCSSTGNVSAVDWVGGLIGRSYGEIVDCRSGASVSGHDRVGGLLGLSYEVTGCRSTGSVSGRDGVGGLVGVSCELITDCRSTGSVSGRDSVGGLLGSNISDECECWRCSSEAEVSGRDRVGGLVGSTGTEVSIVECCSAGHVLGETNVGGLAGYAGKESDIRNCYSVAAVSGKERVGGLLGRIGVYPGADDPATSYIINCYSSGHVSGEVDVGGLVGRSHDILYPAVSFWDVETSQQIVSACGTGLTTTEMQTASTFLEAGWDFVGETANGMEDIWWIDEGQDYPRLWWELSPEN